LTVKLKFGRRSWLLLLLVLWVGCSSAPRRDPAIGEAFVGAASINLRRELGPRQPAVATLKHGERIEILRRHRVFVKVRTAGGVEGWTDSRLLFGAEQMKDLRWLAAQAAELPSQGAATAYGTLNLHNEPNRQAPSFDQLLEGERVEVVAHRLMPRVPYQPSAPPPPVLPTGPADDWSLVRTNDGKAGWALFRMLTMAVPDEVAQYAEGHRITSYFSLGTVKDRDVTKRNWLWTTIVRGLEPYEFDSFRVFVWSRRRHRYETAHIERNLKGYYPVQVEPAASESESPRFSLVIEDKDGQRYRRTYAFQGYRVRLVEKTPWTEPPLVLRRPPSRESEEVEQASKSVLIRAWEAIKGLWRRD